MSTAGFCRPSTVNSQFGAILLGGGDTMKHILIVEDEPDIQELLLAYLRDAGYDAVAFADNDDLKLLGRKAE